MPQSFLSRTSDAFKAAVAGFRLGASGAAPGGLFGSGSGGGSAPAYHIDNRNRGMAGRLSLSMSAEEINYTAKVGDMTKNNAVLSCLMWIMRNYPSAPVRVRNRKTKEVVADHVLEMLLANPSEDPLISYSTLSAGIALSYWGHGNAYLFKVRNQLGQVVELWYRPHWMVKPVREKGSDKFIDYYAYKPDVNTPVKKVPREDVVHLRFGFDPDDEKLGMSPLRGLLRTVFTEQEANSFLATVLTNLGIVGAIITHKPQFHKDDDSGEGEWSTLPDEEGKAIKKTYQEEFTAGKRGGVLLLDGDFETQFPTITVDSGLAERAKEISQADIAAAFGLPPAVLNFLVGLKHQDARAAHESMLRQAYVACLCPMQRDNAQDWQRQLLPEFEGRKRPMPGMVGRTAPSELEVFFDYSDVPAMQESQDLLWKRWLDAWQRGGVTRAELRKALGQESEDGRDDVFFVVKGGLLVPTDHDPTELLELLSSGGSGPPDPAEEIDPKTDDDKEGAGKPLKEPGKGKDKKP